MASLSPVFLSIVEDEMVVSPSTMAAVRASGAVPNAEFLLAADGIRKEFPGVVALDDVQFHLKRDRKSVV